MDKREKRKRQAGQLYQNTQKPISTPKKLVPMTPKRSQSVGKIITVPPTTSQKSQKKIVLLPNKPEEK